MIRRILIGVGTLLVVLASIIIVHTVRLSYEVPEIGPTERRVHALGRLYPPASLRRRRSGAPTIEGVSMAPTSALAWPVMRR